MDLEKLCQNLEPRKEEGILSSMSRVKSSFVSEYSMVTRYYCKLNGELCVGTIDQQVPGRTKLLDSTLVKKCDDLKPYD